jgi:signal transduction histidine kinase
MTTSRSKELEIRARELAVQTERLRESLERLVTARDQQRRGLERDIREGPAQQLLEIRHRLDEAEAPAGSDAAAAQALLDELGADTNATLEELRDLARGISPPLLVDQGIVPALEAHVRKVGANARIHVDPAFTALRFDAEVEACVYFCCLQAIQNVVRHAGNAPSTVEISFGRELLTFTVRDEGPRFDVDARPGGMGTRMKQDRIDALEGALTVESADGHETVVVGRIPASMLEVAP